MKRNIFTALIITVASVMTFTSAAFAAEDIGHGSIRVTIAASDAENLGMRYTTNDDQVEATMQAQEVLRLSGFHIDNDILQPTSNQFSMIKNGNLLTISFDGNPDDTLVRLNAEVDTKQVALALPSDIEIGTLADQKVEILDENDQVVSEVTDELKDYTSVNGMAIRFAVAAPEDLGDGDQNGDQGGDQGGDGDLNPAPASGGCSLMATSTPSAFSALWLAAGLATVLRFRVKKK